MVKRIIMIVAVFFITLEKLEAVSAIIQVKLAEMWFQTIDKYSSKEKQEFILGSLIKNIEYMDDVNITIHVNQKMTLKEIYQIQEPFEAGGQFSFYVESYREKLLQKWGLKEMITDISEDQAGDFLKFLEDEVSYNTQLCKKASSYLSGISEGEILTGVKIEKLAIWHGVLYKYFSQEPSNSIVALQKDKRIRLSITEETAFLWKRMLLFFSDNKKVKSYVEDLFLDFEREFEFFKLKHLKEKDLR